MLVRRAAPSPRRRRRKSRLALAVYFESRLALAVYPGKQLAVFRYFSVRLRRREGKKERESPHPVSVSPSLLVASYFIIDYLGFRRRS